MTQLLELVSPDAPPLPRREPAPVMPKHQPPDLELLQHVTERLGRI
jgi:hypothetical protein